MSVDVREDDGAGIPGGGGTGHSGSEEGVDPFATIGWVGSCLGHGSGGPDSVNGIDTEDWDE